MKKKIRFISAICLAFGVSAAWGQPVDARRYFGHIEAPCHPSKGKAACDELIARIRNLDNCKTADDKCDEGKYILRALFGENYRNTLPDFLLYLDQRSRPDGEVQDLFRASKPVLMFRDQNTPHLFGVRDVYAFVFSEKKACIDGVVATEFRNEPNPFSAIFTVLGKSFTGSGAAAKDDREPINFAWYPLSGNPKAPGMWYGVARAGIDVGSTNRITVRYKQPKPKPAAKDEKAAEKDKPKPQATAAGEEDECTAPPVPAGQEAAVYAGNFLAANAFFSNSPDSQVTVALALGTTFNVKDTSVASGGSDVSYNGYALVKFYPERFRPRLHAGPQEVGPRKSFGWVVGTNVLNDAFAEFVFGASLGHIWGNVGVTAGINSIEGKKDTDQGRKERLFLGLDYSF